LRSATSASGRPGTVESGRADQVPHQASAHDIDGVANNVDRALLALASLGNSSKMKLVVPEGVAMRWHWNDVVRLIGLIVGLAAAIWDKYINTSGSGWVLGLVILIFLALPITIYIVSGIRDRLVTWMN
jgi:hypothetical protein